jgi:hypothetical protein
MVTKICESVKDFISFHFHGSQQRELMPPISRAQVNGRTLSRSLSRSARDYAHASSAVQYKGAVKYSSRARCRQSKEVGGSPMNPGET